MSKERSTGRHLGWTFGHYSKLSGKPQEVDLLYFRKKKKIPTSKGYVLTVD